MPKLLKNLLVKYLPLWLPLCVLLPGLGWPPLFDVDEGAFSEATREMLASGDYLSTWLNGNPRFDKPILIYWLQALSVSLFGPQEWAFRLPSALAAAVWCFVISRFTEAFFDRQAGRMACFVTLSCLGVLLIGRASTADALLNMFLALAMADLWRYLATGSINAARRTYLWVGLGLLTKGPVALLIPGATVFLWSLTSHQWGPLLRALKDGPGWLLLLGTSLPWYITAYLIHGDAFLQGFFIRHNVQRFSSTLEGHGGGLLYFLVLIPILLLPWLPWLWKSLRSIRENWPSPLHRFLWIWCGFVLLFFSLSGTKLPHYALYGCSPLFVLIASEYRCPTRPRLVFVPVILALLTLCSLPFWLGSLPVKPGFYADQLARLDGEMIRAQLWPACMVLAIGLVAAIFRRPQAWQQVAALSILSSLAITLWLAPLFGELLQGPVKRTALLAREAGRTVVQWQAHWPSISVYLAAETPLRAPEPGELAITRTDRLPTEEGYVLLHREGGVALVARR